MMRFEVQAGETARAAGPVSVAVPAAKLATAPVLALIETKTKKPVPCQLTPNGKLCWWVDAMNAGEKRTFEVSAAGLAGSAEGVVVDDGHPDKVDVRIGRKALTTYNFGGTPEHPRPYLYPLIGPTDVSVTRHYPMRPGVPEEREDHRHHQSFWVAWGKINDVDHWSTSDRCGFQKHRWLVGAVSGPVFGRIESLIDWTTRQGQRQLTELRSYTFWRADDDVRVVDLSINFHFTDGDVKFGDTKEGGLCSTRVAGTMKEKSGGTITNAEGKQGAGACWGKPSPWVDYTGKAGEHTVGLTIFDNPKNFRYPSRWHVRDYGLFTANVFGLSHFVSKESDGSHTWKAGELVTFDYRVLIHKDDVKAGRVADHYRNYTKPAAVKVV